jgi:hypothetical protein
MGPRKDISGKLFGTTVAVSATPRRDVSGEVFWACRCECGYHFDATSSALQRGRHQKCPICRDKASTLSPYKTLYSNYRRGAKLRGLAFELDFDYFIELTKLPCTYCGSDPFMVLKKEGAKYGIVYSGLDRQDNSLGYTQENTAPCCKFCNYAKSRYPLEEFLAWLSSLQNVKVGNE